MALTAPPNLPTPTGYIEVSPQWAHSAAVPAHLLLQLVWWLGSRRIDADLVTNLWVTPADHDHQHVLIDAFTAHDALTQHRLRHQFRTGADDQIIADLRQLRIDTPRMTVAPQAKVEIIRDWKQEAWR